MLTRVLLGLETAEEKKRLKTILAGKGLGRGQYPATQPTAPLEINRIILS